MARCRYPLGHFPWAVPHRPLGVASKAGPAVPLEVAKRWYWRVFAWKMELQYSASAMLTKSDGTAQGIDWINTVVLDGTDPNAGGGPLGGSNFLQDETGLVQQTEYRLFGTVPLTCYIFTRESAAGGVSDGIGLGFNPDTNLYLPIVVLAAQCVSTTYVDGVNDSLSFGLVFDTGAPADIQCPFEDNFTRGAANVVVTIDTYQFTIPVSLYVTDPGGGNSLLLQSFSAQVTITPSEYWQYTGADGVPLYVAGTGNPAVNPATGASFTPAEIAAAPLP